MKGGGGSFFTAILGVFKCGTVKRPDPLFKPKFKHECKRIWNGTLWQINGAYGKPWITAKRTH
jgi:hypothetical protein